MTWNRPRLFVIWTILGFLALVGSVFGILSRSFNEESFTKNVQAENNEYEQSLILRHRPIEYFMDIPDILHQSLVSLNESENQSKSTPGFIYKRIKYLSSGEYKDYLKKCELKSNGLFLRLGEWKMEFETGLVTGYYSDNFCTVYFKGNIDFQKQPMEIKIGIHLVESVHSR